MLENYLPILVFIVLGLGLGIGLELVGFILGKNKPDDAKNSPFECGFDAFAVRADKSLADALKGLDGLSVLYGRSVIEPRPLFRRGRYKEESRS